MSCRPTKSAPMVRHSTSPSASSPFSQCLRMPVRGGGGGVGGWAGVYARCRKQVIHMVHRHTDAHIFIYMSRYTHPLTQALLRQAQQVHLGLRGVQAQRLLVPVDGLLDVAPQGAHVRAVRHRLQVGAVELWGEGGGLLVVII